MVALQKNFWLTHHDTGGNKKKDAVYLALTFYRPFLTTKSSLFPLLAVSSLHQPGRPPSGEHTGRS
jgi:hypothetical protein